MGAGPPSDLAGALAGASSPPPAGGLPAARGGLAGALDRL